MSDRPNLLVITTDQQHHAMMGCAGNRWLRTPAMDRIAAWGTRFTRAYCSNPVCVPSRFSWWTGRMPSAIGMRGNGGVKGPLPEEVHQEALGHQLRRAGDQVAFGGKLHTPGGLTTASMGFDLLCRDERDRLAVEAARYIRQDHDRTWFLAANFINPHDICYQAIRAFECSDMDRAIMRGGVTELAELDAALQVPPGVDEATFFAEHCPPLPANFEPQADEPAAIGAILDERSFKRQARECWSEREWRLHRWAYHRLTERVDSQIAVVLDALEASGQLEDTVIVFTSDHVDHSASPRLEHKPFFSEEAARIPLIVARPGHGPAGVVDDRHLCNNGIDLMATCCDYAGVDRPAHNRGLSWRPLAEGRNVADWREGSYGENTISHMYVTRDHKYLSIENNVCGHGATDGRDGSHHGSSERERTGDRRAVRRPRCGGRGGRRTVRTSARRSADTRTDYRSGRRRDVHRV
jgi:arylsulfatase A-like enzyme